MKQSVIRREFERQVQKARQSGLSDSMIAHVMKDKFKGKLPERTLRNWTQQLKIKGGYTARKPPQPLLKLTNKYAESIANYLTSWTKVKRQGMAEGFSEKELKDILREKIREHLKSLGLDTTEIEMVEDFAISLL